MRGLHWLLLMVLLTLTGQATSGAQSQPAAGRDQVVIGIAGFGESEILNPLFLPFTVTPLQGVLATMFVSDVSLDDSWRPFPLGVEYLPDIKNGTWKLDGDRMTLIWKLRPRNWHDGTPVTCADYVFAFTVARDERVPTLRRPDPRISNIACTKGERGTEIMVNWNERYADAGQAITGAGKLPRHVLEPFYRRNPSKLDESPYGHDPQVTVGDGAYRLVEWRKGESLTVESVGTHPILGTPKIKRITWRFVFLEDRNALVANMLLGAIDVVSIFGFQERFDLAIQLEGQAAGRIKVLFEPGLSWEHMDFNLDNPILQDVRIRRAIAHGINRTQITQQLFQGRQPVSHIYLPPKHPAYTDAVQKYPYDPERARRLLQQAGFTPGPNGIMQNAAGQRLALELNTTSASVREQVVTMIQEQLRQVGIEITILNFPARVFYGSLIQRRQFKALAFYGSIWGWPLSIGCDGLYTSDRIPSESNGWVGANWPGYRNAEMDKVCKAASREVDAVKRYKLLSESAVILSRDLPTLPIYYGVRSAAAKVGLQNFSLGFPCLGSRCNPSETWNVHQWYWR